jgi:hypothetical protein
MVGADEAVVSVLEVGFKSYYCLLGHFFDLPLELADVLASFVQGLEDTRHQLLGTFVVFPEIISGIYESLTVFVEREVGEVHVQILDV